MRHSYKTSGTCSQEIHFDLEEGRIMNVSFIGGCNGNLKAISKLVEGMSGEKLIEMLKGNTCGTRPTSCADQLARAVEQALRENG